MTWLLANWRIVALLGSLAASFGSGIWVGIAWDAKAQQRARIEALQRLVDEQARLAEEDRQVIDWHIEHNGKVRTVYQTLWRQYVDWHTDWLAGGTGCSLNDRGLRLWQQANAGHTAIADEPMSAPSTAPFRFAPRLAAQPHGDSSGSSPALWGPRGGSPDAGGSQ